MPQSPPPPVSSTLTVAGIQARYSLGHHLARALAKLLPHATVGRMLMVRAADMDALMDRAIADGADLWDIARESDPEKILGWIRR